MYLHDDAALFEEVLLGTAAEFSMSEEFVAKDYWAMMMLAEAMKRSETLVFKGGTCLSKCYGAISRFSEDVDLGIPYEHATEGMRKAIKRTVVDSADALGVAISNLPETRSSREYNRYGIALGGMARSLILETAVMTPASPYSIRPAQSFAGAFVESRDASLAKELGLLTFEVRANSLEHTFADKVFAICDYYMLAISQLASPDTSTICASCSAWFRRMTECDPSSRPRGLRGSAAMETRRLTAGLTCRPFLRRSSRRGRTGPITSGSRCRCCMRTSPTTRP